MQRLLISLLLFALAACSSSADTKRAEQAVVRFHELLDAGQSTAIYEAAADDLKKIAKQKEFVELLDAVHRKLGVSKSATQKGWNVNYNLSGNFITLSYETVYAEGKALEQFVFRITEHEALLAGYNVNSNVFVIK